MHLKSKQHTPSTSTVKTKTSTLSPSTSVTSEEKPPLKLCPNINKLLFTTFLEILETEDYSLLIISGEATDEELIEAWNKLHGAYTEALNSGEESPEMQDSRITLVNNSRIMRARTLLDAIVQVGAHKGLVSQLYSFGYDLPECTDKNATRVVELFTANYKRDYVDLQANTLQAEELKQDMPVIDTNYYLETIAIIMTSMKCSIDISSLTLGLYVALVKQYKQHCKSILKLQNNGHG